MSEADTIDTVPNPPGKSKRLILPLLALICALAGFSVSYMGFWSPFPAAGQRVDAAAAQVPDVAFVDVPPLILSLPGAAPRTLVMTVKIEAETGKAAHVRQMIPRISDAFNVFLSEIDPVAFQRRGILEIIRNEMITRLSYALGPDSFDDLLITEFRIQ